MCEWHDVFQPIFQVDKDLNPSVDHYEMLLRDQNGKFPIDDFFRVIGTEEDNQQWIQTESQALAKVFKAYPNIHVNLNIEPIQFTYLSVWDFLKQTYDRYGQKVIIEITERQLQAGSIGGKYFDRSFQRIHDLGFKIALDDVDSGSNSFSFVSHHLDQISIIKLSLLIFDDISTETMIQFIDAWVAFAKEKHLSVVLEAVRSKEIAQRYAGNKNIYQQGYYWEKGLELKDMPEEI
ncbi:EAL domain-containing protein [Lactobacillus amylovorus]|uniref:EAL domain-containing protein n=1 Tax=Lactobacillus amylovorus TaxID=1604 RepID=UPI003F8E5E31